MNIIIPRSKFDGNSAFQRVFLPMSTGAKKGLFQVKMLDGDYNEDTAAKLFDGANIYYQGTMAKWKGAAGDDNILVNFKDRAFMNFDRIKAGLSPLMLVGDYDDWNHGIPPTSVFYTVMGDRETYVEISNDEETYGMAWQDGKTKHKLGGVEYTFNIAENKTRRESIMKHMVGFDALTTTTEYLANKLREFNDNVYVIPNGIDFDLYNCVKKESPEIRIGYMYSASHYADWLEIAPVIRDVVNEQIGVKLVLFGGKPPMPMLKKFDPAKVEFHPYKSYSDGYYDEFTSLNLDIGLCPLIDNEFNLCKSPLKWQEYSAIKAVTVASNTLYGKHIKDGKTGFIYHDMKELRGVLRYLITRPETRKKISNQAYDFVKANYDMSNIVEKHKLAFEKIAEKGVKDYEKSMATV